ncbi:MAG: integral rane sensor hybrid histidine kinase [Verrucomicrobiaceae bacterium]|nr:integral rane sensor hybrid histidine kinase [Verrucomicrobiaceae bacterium]
MTATDTATGGSPQSLATAELLTRFEQSEEKVRVTNFRVAAALALVFMLAGSTLDIVVLRSYAASFFAIRVICALCLGGVLVALSKVHHGRGLTILGHLVASLPMASILWMIASSEGGESSYYAGLNLVLMGASLLLRWRTKDSIINSVLCLGGFLFVALHGMRDGRMVFNNFYFLFVTAVFACTGTYFYNRLRFNEFRLMHELETNRREMEENHRKLQSLDEAKTRFFSNVSHELRTPLTLILGPLEQLKRAPSLMRDTRHLELVAMLEENGLRLLRLINELLDLVRLDSADMPQRSTRTNLRQFIGALAESLRATAETKQINLRHRFDSDEGDYCWIDRDKLEKILLNLAINAIKFTPRDGSIDVEAKIASHTLHLTVKDTGAGIKQDDQTLVFERFWQADMSSRRKHGGVGIGLALVKSLTQSLGGSIRVESTPGRGTSFFISLPLMQGEEDDSSPDNEEAEAPDMVEQLHQSARLSGVTDSDDFVTPSLEMQTEWEDNPENQALRVLIADDEPRLRRYLADSMEGFKVIEARDGNEAWELSKQYLPHIIILDYMMPEMDGVELTRRLRAHKPTSRIPILLVTANAENLPRLEALEAGVSEFITKPFSTVELNARVRNLVRQKQYERDLSTSKQELEVAHEELKENESRLLQAERLSALGRMSAGIIHEVNNPLNYTRTALHALKSFSRQIDEADRADYEEVVGDAREGVDRVIRIVSDLRAFTKGSPSNMGEMLLAATVEAARRLISEDLTGINVHIDVPDNIEVYGNENQLCQVFMNLLQNSSSFVLAAKKRGEEPRIEVKAQRTNSGMVMVTVYDNGCGIAPEDISRVFDPFFTRRDVGAGMGLGLSICHQILQAHQARVEIRSEINQYTEFSLCFPPPASIIRTSSADLESL